MSIIARKFIDCLEDAWQTLESHPLGSSFEADRTLGHDSAERFDLALIEKWSEFCEPETAQRPFIRIIQHLSCTGGSLYCKCLASMPNVCLLSEVNPLSELDDVHRSGFAPSDLTYLAKQGKFPFVGELSEKIFKADMNVIAEHLHEIGKYLLVREHAHSEFLLERSSAEIVTIRSLLEDCFDVMSVTTVRHPVDSYLSLQNNGWVRFSPPTFEEYCRRYLLFLEAHADVPVFRYEEFVASPGTHLRSICSKLGLPFNDDFADIFDIQAVSGDSGRSSGVISKRSRRHLDRDFLDEINCSESYVKLCSRLEYDQAVIES